MTYKEFSKKLLDKYGISYEVTDELGNGCFKGVRNGIEWKINDTCSWDSCYQLEYNGYRANRISIKMAVKKLLQL